MAAAKSGARISVLKTYKLYMGGGFPRSESGRYFQVMDAKGQLVANVARSSRKDFRMAVRKARGALGGWTGRSAFNRGQILYRMAEMLEGRRATFVELLVEAGSKPADASTEVDNAIDRLVLYAGWTDKYATVFGSTNPVASPHFNFTVPEPTGVVTAYPSKGSPLLGLVTAFAPLIATGNTAICVVDNAAPHISVALGEVLQNSDLPGAVVNFLPAVPGELDAHVGSHMDVDGILAFCDDAEVRKQWSLLGAESLKRVKLFDEVSAAELASETYDSPYFAMLPFTEFKTAWHPTGGVIGGAGKY